MQPFKMIFHLPQKDSSSLHQTEIEVIEFKTSETNLKISECKFESKNILLEIKHNEINTLLDFKNAPDYRVLFLDKNNFVHGGTYAINNSIGYKIQTQSKRLLLVFMNHIATNEVIRTKYFYINSCSKLNKLIN